MQTYRRVYQPGKAILFSGLGANQFDRASCMPRFISPAPSRPESTMAGGMDGANQEDVPITVQG